MKIQNDPDRKIGDKVLSKVQTGSKPPEDTEFLAELKEVHGEKIKAELDELLEMIDEQGERLAHNRTFKELIKYKKRVRNFVEQAVEKMYQLKEEYSPSQGQIQTLVKSVDDSLEGLTELVLDEQAAQIDILDQLDEVRGLLIDLYR